MDKKFGELQPGQKFEYRATPYLKCEPIETESYNDDGEEVLAVSLIDGEPLYNHQLGDDPDEVVVSVLDEGMGIRYVPPPVPPVPDTTAPNAPAAPQVSEIKELDGGQGRATQ